MPRDIPPARLTLDHRACCPASQSQDGRTSDSVTITFVTKPVKQNALHENTGTNFMKASTHCQPVPGHARGLHPDIKIVPTPSGSQASYWRGQSCRHPAARRPATGEANRADGQRPPGQLPASPSSTSGQRQSCRPPPAHKPATSGPFKHIWPAAPASMTSRPLRWMKFPRLPPAGRCLRILNRPGASALQGGRLPWAWPEATTASGQTPGLGVDAGPMAICDQPACCARPGGPGAGRRSPGSGQPGLTTSRQASAPPRTPRPEPAFRERFTQ